MIDLRMDVLDVPLSEATVVQLRFGNTNPRTLLLQNLTSSTLTIKIQESADGGSTWTLVGTTITLGPAGGGTEIESEQVTSANILRIRGSGGGDDRDMLFAVFSLVEDATYVWGSPLI